MRTKIINFTIDLIEQPHIKQSGIVFFDGYSNAIGVDIVDEHITGLPENSQNIVLLSFLEIYSVIFHRNLGQKQWEA